jgi:hypothetical protein
MRRGEKKTHDFAKWNFVVEREINCSIISFPTWLKLRPKMKTERSRATRLTNLTEKKLLFWTRKEAKQTVFQVFQPIEITRQSQIGPTKRTLVFYTLHKKKTKRIRFHQTSVSPHHSGPHNPKQYPTFPQRTTSMKEKKYTSSTLSPFHLRLQFSNSQITRKRRDFCFDLIFHSEFVQCLGVFPRRVRLLGNLRLCGMGGVGDHSCDWSIAWWCPSRKLGFVTMITPPRDEGWQRDDVVTPAWNMVKKSTFQNYWNHKLDLLLL